MVPDKYDLINIISDVVSSTLLSSTGNIISVMSAGPSSTDISLTSLERPESFDSTIVSDEFSSEACDLLSS